MSALLLLLCSSLAAAKPFPAPEVMGAFEGNLRSGYAFVSVVSPETMKRLPW